MPTATITSTENTFGTISGTFASDQSTITGTISGIITGTLEGSIGVPGPQGIQGPTGPAGEGVVAGGSANQVLSKIDSTDYNTQWSDPVVFDGGNITGPITMENETDRSVTSAYGYSCENLNNNQQNSSLNYAALYIQSYPSAMQVTATAITFPDSTTQSTSATNLGYITDAPADGPIYGRVNNSWTPVYAFTGGPITSAITFTDGSTVTGFESGSFYVNRTDGYSAALQLNSLSLSSDTQSIGIVAAGITFADATFQSTAATPFDGGDITGPITMHNGSYDSEMSASVFGVELTSDTTQNASLSYTGLNVQITGSALTVTATGITFPDASTQTVAFPGFTGYAPLESPAFTGTPTAPTATLGDDSTQIATTAFVQDAVISGSAHAETLQATVRNNTGSTLASFTVVYISGAVGNRAAVAKAQANSEATSSGTFAVTESSIANNADGIVISAGVLSNVNTSAYTDGDKLYLSPTVAGGVTTTKPSAPNHLVYVGVVTRSHPTLGTVSVRIQNGYELNEIHDVAIASVADKDLLSYESSTSLWKNKSFGTLGLATLSGPTFTGVPAAPTASVSTNTTQLATTAFVVGQVGTATPLVNGTAAVGTSLLYARQDHVHGTDTTRAAVDSQAFTGTPSLPTGTTATTQTAGDNTTKLATTAFVKAAVPAFGSVTDVLNPSSSTKVLTLDKVGLALASPNFISLAHITYTQISGSGAVTAGSGGTFGREMYLNSLAVGRASFNYGIPSSGTAFIITNYSSSTKIDWSKPIRLSGSHKFGDTSYEGDANTYSRITLGGYSAVGTGDMAFAGIGIRKVGGVASKIFLTVHNGTTLTNVDSGIAPSTTNGVNWVIDSDGAGNVSLYINNSLVATTTSGPTALSAVAGNLYREQVEATATPTVKALLLGSGGWIYINR